MQCLSNSHHSQYIYIKSDKCSRIYREILSHSANVLFPKCENGPTVKHDVKSIVGCIRLGLEELFPAHH